MSLLGDFGARFVLLNARQLRAAHPAAFLRSICVKYKHKNANDRRKCGRNEENRRPAESRGAQLRRRSNLRRGTRRDSLARLTWPPMMSLMPVDEAENFCV